MGNLNFDATNVAPATAFDPIKPGWYTMRIVGAEVVPSEKAGPMLKLEHEIDENKHPELASRKVFSNLCINHPTSQQAREIAQRTLSSIGHSVGILQIADSEQLLGATLKVKLGVRPARTDESGKSYDASNDVKGYKSVNEETEAPPAATAPANGSPATPGTAPAAATKPSWKR